MEEPNLTYEQYEEELAKLQRLIQTTKKHGNNGRTSVRLYPSASKSTHLKTKTINVYPVARITVYTPSLESVRHTYP